MRIALALVPLSLVAAPACAQPAPAEQQQVLQLQPDTAERITDALHSVSKAMDDLSNDPAKAAEIQQRIAEARPQIDRSIKAINQALPEITADLRRAQQALKRAIANMPDPNYPKR